MDDNRGRRRELPRVWPKPGSRGPTANRCRLSSGSPMASTVGRWMMSMLIVAPRRVLLRSGASGLLGGADWLGAVPGARGTAVVLLGVQLDDELLLHGLVDVLAQWKREHLDGEFVPDRLQPWGELAIEGVHVPPD